MSVAASVVVTDRYLCQDSSIPRVQLDSAFEVAYGIVVTSLTPFNVTFQLKKLRIVG